MLTTYSNKEYLEGSRKLPLLPRQIFYKMIRMYPAVHVLMNCHWNFKALKDLTTNRHKILLPFNHEDFNEA